MKRIIGVAVLLGAVVFISVGRETSKPARVYADDGGAKWGSTDLPLTVNNLGNYASAEGYWQSTSAEKGKQLSAPMAATVECHRDRHICIEAQASAVSGYILKATVMEYSIASWGATGIIADATDEGICGVGHRLSIDFPGNSVLVTDYPKKASDGKNVLSGKDMCGIFTDANSYTMKGGYLYFHPGATWNALAKR